MPEASFMARRNDLEPDDDQTARIAYQRDRLRHTAGRLIRYGLDGEATGDGKGCPRPNRKGDILPSTREARGRAADRVPLLAREDRIDI